ncbi:putative porin [Winogradskyella sp. DF17]|uniref:Porin n=1 Tax=Winogradskyella pelagia TaxID=2819984 RepID=A0ABS3T2N7_9FLAO|nr:putative porin [Winogradskyella sp. DF17]MBO3116992.1 putative porin [Winogradskyella sp. DF17]
MKFTKTLSSFFVIVLCTVGSLNGQINPEKRNQAINDQNNPSNKSKKVNKNDLATIDLYKIVKATNDTTFVDTTLSLKKLYKFNYLQEDNFGLISFANIGQTYNTLTFNSAEQYSLPLFGASARHFNYKKGSDMEYFEVPTPWTRLTYKTAFTQGQLLDAFFTINMSKQFNFSIAHKGLRSIGNYQHALTSSNNLRITSNYKSLNKRYNARGHMTWQRILNEENGGIRDEDIINFTSGNEEFLDREVFDPNFEDAEGVLIGKRFYLDHTFEITKPKDSIQNNKLLLLNTVSFEDMYFEYVQTSPATDFFGSAFSNTIRDRATLENFQTDVGVSYFNNLIGELKFKLEYSDLNYGYNSVVLLNNQNIPNRIQANVLAVNGQYKKMFSGFIIEGKAGLNLSDDFGGNYIYGNIGYQLNQDIYLEGALSISSRLPNYNFLLYQSDYLNYNWYNFGDYNNVNTQQISFSLKSEKYLDIDFDISNIDNYTFFNLEGIEEGVKIIKPRQYQNTIQYLRIKFRKDLRYGKFGLDNTVLYQNVISDEDVLNVPAIVTRNTFYFSDQLFKKALTFQTGVVFNYFTKYNMNGYDPLLAEFYTQNNTELGGFPRLDFFVNAKIRQTRIFLIAEHFNSSFTGYDFFSAPNNPYRDFTIRFGLVWDFFL